MGQSALDSVVENEAPLGHLWGTFKKTTAIYVYGDYERAL